MKSKTLLGSFLVAVFALTAIVYVFKFSNLAGNVLFLISPFMAVIAAISAVRTYQLSNNHGRIIALLSAGLLCWFIGEFIFFLFQFVWHIEPYPSIADIFYLAGYPLLFAGLIKEIRDHKVSWHNFNKLTLTFIVLLLLLLSIIVLYFGVFLAYTAGDPVMSNLISTAYGIGDLILIVPSLFILKIALDYRGGKLYNSWMMILSALMLMLTGDILFAIFKDNYSDLLWPYTLIDLLYVASYLLFAYSFFYTAAT